MIDLDLQPNGDGTWTDPYGRRLVPSRAADGRYGCRVVEDGHDAGSVSGWPDVETAALMAARNFTPHWHTLGAQAADLLGALRASDSGAKVTADHAEAVRSALLLHGKGINHTHRPTWIRPPSFEVDEGGAIAVRVDYEWYDTHHVFDGDEPGGHGAEMVARIPLLVTPWADERHADHHRRMLKVYRAHHYEGRTEYRRAGSGPIRKAAIESPRAQASRAGWASDAKGAPLPPIVKAHWDAVDAILAGHMKDTNDSHRGHVGAMPQATPRLHPDGRAKIELTIPYAQIEVHVVAAGDDPGKHAEEMGARLSRWDNAHGPTAAAATRPTATR